MVIMKDLDKENQIKRKSKLKADGGVSELLAADCENAWIRT